MQFLLIYLAVYVLHKFSAEPLVTAATHTGILVAMLYFCWKLGGWTSPSAALRWLLQNKQSFLPVAVPVLAGSLLPLALWLYSGKYSPLVAVVEAVWVYFFFHGCSAVWFALMRTLPGHDDAA